MQLNDHLKVGSLFLERAIRYRSTKDRKWKFSADEVGTAIFAFYKIAATARKKTYVQQLKQVSPCYTCINLKEEEVSCLCEHNMEEESVEMRGESGCLDYERGPSYDKDFIEKELRNIEAFWSEEKVMRGIIDLADRLKFLAKESLKKEELKGETK